MAPSGVAWADYAGAKHGGKEGRARRCALIEDCPAGRAGRANTRMRVEVMTPRQFYPLNLVAILLWAAVHVFPGVLAGKAYQRAGAIAGHLTLPIILGIAAIGFLIWGIRRWLKVA